MAGAIVGTPAQVLDGGTYTAESGSNRVVVYAFGYEAGSAGQSVTSCTFGGVAMTVGLFQAFNNASGNNACAGIYYIKEADIVAGSQTLAIATSTGPLTGVETGYMYTLSGIDQTAPVQTTGNGTVGAGTSVAASFTSVDGSVCIGSVASTSATNFSTESSGWSETGEFDDAGGWSMAAYQKTAATGASETLTVDISASVKASLVAVCFKQVASAAADITSVTGPGSVANLIRQGESSTIAGTGFEASQSTGNVDLSGVSLTETAWSDTSITITGPSSGLMFGASKTLTVTPATNDPDSIAGQTYLPPTGQSYITFDAGGISGMSPSSIGYGITGLAANDQARFETTATKVGDPGTTCTVTVEEGSGNIELTNVTAAGSYEFSAWFRDASDNTDSGESVITFDAIAPEIDSAAFDVTGLVFTMTLTEDAAVGAGGSGGVTLTGQYGSIVPTFDSISGADVIYTVNRPAYDNEVILLNYIQPGAGITDTVGNELASFAEQEIANNSAEAWVSTGYGCYGFTNFNNFFLRF